jgi:SWI/SNF-related matrix-associated actin-dependent regulator of chromatin subfamily D
VETFLPESAAFMKLLELERQMDYTLRRKRLAIHEALHRPARVRGTLRVYLFNTYANQAEQKSADPDAPPSWTLYVSGRLVDGQPTTPAQVAQQVRNTLVSWRACVGQAWGGKKRHGARPRDLARTYVFRARPEVC